MTMYRKILVPLDGSADSASALRHATALARDQNARLTLLAVCPMANKAAGLGAMAVPDRFEVYGALVREAAMSLPGDLGVTTQVLRGEPAATIIKIAGRDGHDLVVMVSAGHGRVRRALLGSVSDRVMADATIPVLLISASGAESSPWYSC